MHALLPGILPPTVKKHRVVIIDDNTFFAACLRALLDNESDLGVCGVTAVGPDLSDRVRRLQPDLLVIDLSLGADSGLQLGRRLRDKCGIETPILFISSVGRPCRSQLSAVRRSAFVSKSGRPAELLRVVREMLKVEEEPLPVRGFQTELEFDAALR